MYTLKIRRSFRRAVFVSSGIGLLLAAGCAPLLQKADTVMAEKVTAGKMRTLATSGLTRTWYLGSTKHHHYLFVKGLWNKLHKVSRSELDCPFVFKYSRSSPRREKVKFHQLPGGSLVILRES